VEVLLIGILLMAGLLFGTLGSRYLGVPRVVGYILLGMLFAPDLLGGWLGMDATAWTEPMVSVALGIIAYLIGGSASIAQLKRLGWGILGATAGKVSGAFLVVLVAVGLAGQIVGDLPGWTFALVIAAIAPTTAPAAIVAVIHQYRARGPLTTTLLGMVALDDALGIMIFSLVLAFVGAESLDQALPAAAWDIGGAILVGAATGFLLERISRRLHERELRLVALVGGIVLLVGLAQAWAFSALLAAMSLGFSIRFFGGTMAEREFEPVEQLEELVFVLFFTFAGLHFDPQVVIQYAPLILLYFVARAAGLAGGATLGARLARAPGVVVRNVGLGLLPQGGVAIGLALLLAGTSRFAETGELIVNIVTATTLLTESIGSVAARFGLQRAGEVNQVMGGPEDEGK